MYIMYLVYNMMDWRKFIQRDFVENWIDIRMERVEILYVFSLL